MVSIFKNHCNDKRGSITASVRSENPTFAAGIVFYFGEVFFCFQFFRNFFFTRDEPVFANKDLSLII